MTWIHFTASRTDTPKKSNTQASMGENMKLFTGRNFERSGVQKRRRRSSIKGLGRKLLHSHKQARTQLFSSPAKDLTDTIWRSIFCIIYQMIKSEKLKKLCWPTLCFTPVWFNGICMYIPSDSFDQMQSAMYWIVCKTLPHHRLYNAHLILTTRKG